MGVWVFGYGSLMWKIDFPTIRKVTGYVQGFVRTMEWADEVHRGVPGNQSRTAAIFESKSIADKVWGVSYEISQEYWDREVAPKVGYRERGGYGVVDTEFIPFDANVNNVPGKIMVRLFLGDKKSPYYKPGTIEELAHHIVQAVGASGTNLEYLYSTAEALRMILPAGVTDEHMFALEAACRKLEALERPKEIVKEDLVLLEEKYEKRRDLLLKIYKQSDLNMNRQMTLQEFYDLAVNKLSLNETFAEVKKKFERIDVNGDGTLSTKEFIDYFLTELQEHDNKFKNEYQKFGMKQPEGGENAFEDALLMYEIGQDAGLNSLGGVSSLGEMLQNNRTLLDQLRVRTVPEAREVLEFFFPDSIRDAMELWFGKSRENDKMVKEKFSFLVEKALDGKLDDWMNTPNNCLALVILLNQFSRNIYRNTAKMYAGDEKALGVTLKAIFYGYWKSLSPLQTVFLPCMVLSTSENLHFQELSVQIWINYIQEKLPNEDPLRIIQSIFKQNYEVIKQFGRFPHRNKLLGRKSTPEETAMLGNAEYRLDQPKAFTDDGFVRLGGGESNNPWPDFDFNTKLESLRID